MSEGPPARGPSARQTSTGSEYTSAVAWPERSSVRMIASLLGPVEMRKFAAHGVEPPALEVDAPLLPIPSSASWAAYSCCPLIAGDS